MCLPIGAEGFGPQNSTKILTHWVDFLDQLQFSRKCVFKISRPEPPFKLGYELELRLGFCLGVVVLPIDGKYRPTRLASNIY